MVKFNGLSGASKLVHVSRIDEWDVLRVFIHEREAYVICWL